MTKGLPWTYRHLWDEAGQSWAAQSAVTGNEFFGLRIKFLADGFLLGTGYYRDSMDTGNHSMYVRHIGPGKVTPVRPFRYHNPNDRAVTAWEWSYFTRRIPIAANDVYVIFDLMGPFVWYASTVGVPPGGIVTTHFQIPKDTSGAPNGCSSTIATFNPGTSLGDVYPGIDVIWWDGLT